MPVTARVENVKTFGTALIEARDVSPYPDLFMLLMRSNNLITIRYQEWEGTVDVSYDGSAVTLPNGGQEYHCTIKAVVPEDVAARMKDNLVEIMEAR